MANSVGLRFNNIEEERVLGAMLAAGDENVSTHIKRVYFAALDRKDDYTVEYYCFFRKYNNQNRCC